MFKIRLNYAIATLTLAVPLGTGIALFPLQTIAAPAKSPSGLREGMPYPEARKLILQQGWQPNQLGDPADLADQTVKTLFNSGYIEIKACSGTGLGPCRFEFTNAAGDLLMVSAIPGQRTTGTRSVWRWGIEPETSYRFSKQDLTQALLSQVYQLNKACGFYNANAKSPCWMRRYIFKDVVVLAQRREYGATTLSIAPTKPISKQQAIGYANALDNRREIDFAKPKIEPDRIVYRGCPESFEKSSPPLCYAILNLTKTGKVSTVELSHTTP
jgi:hypothetical protein